MIDEIDAGYIMEDHITLAGAEDYIRAIENNIKVGMALLATALGRIKKEGLYYEVARDFKSYIRLERTHLGYREALRLSRIGENYWNFKTQIRENHIKVSKNMSKLLYLDERVIENDPMFWDRFKSLSVRQLKDYIKQKRGEIYVYPQDSENRNVTVKGASLYMGKEKIRGLNLNDVCRAMDAGKRVITVFVDDDVQARRVMRHLDGLL